MDDLIGWLRAQLDDDERVARVLEGEGWNAAATDAHGMRRVMVNYSTECVVSVTLAVRGEHIARWDPARVLAEIDAKRRIIDEHRHYPVSSSYLSGVDDTVGCLICGLNPNTMAISPDGWCPTVRLLALPYAGQPGYRQDWRP